MNLTIVSYARGRTGFEAAEAEYMRRLSGQGAVEIEVVRQWDDRTELPARLVEGGYPVGLYVAGRAFTSEQLADHLGQLMRQGQSHLVVAVGGAEGLPAGVAAQVRERWSLSPLTFSHGLARLLSLEALYRSLDILRGGPYHKGKATAQK